MQPLFGLRSGTLGVAMCRSDPGRKCSKRPAGWPPPPAWLESCWSHSSGPSGSHGFRCSPGLCADDSRRAPALRRRFALHSRCIQHLSVSDRRSKYLVARRDRNVCVGDAHRCYRWSRNRFVTAFVLREISRRNPLCAPPYFSVDFPKHLRPNLPHFCAVVWVDLPYNR